MNLKHTLNLNKIDNIYGPIEVFKVIGSTDYEKRLIVHEGVEIIVLEHIGNELLIDSIRDCSDLLIHLSTHPELYKRAYDLFNVPSFDFSFNCHSYTFLNSNNHWFNNQDSIKAISDNIYDPINDKEDVQEGDVFIFILNNSIVHSLIFKQGLYCHKIGPKGILQDHDLSDAISIYPNCIINHLRKKRT